MKAEKKIGKQKYLNYSKLKSSLRNEISMGDSSRAREKLIEAEAEISTLKNEI